MPQNPASSSASYMGDPSQMMAGLTPAFMNHPQYQQQMQGLAMQVRQQEEGTKKIKKFLKAYEDIQLSAPMMPQQAPQQPGFMQPPGGNVQSMNNRLPRNEPQYEEAPTSFTELAGGQMPEDSMTSIGEDAQSPSGDTANSESPEELYGVDPNQPYGPNRDAQGKPYTSPTMTNTGGVSMNTKLSPEELARKAEDQAEADAYDRRMGMPRKRLESKIESRDKREDKLPLEQRGDKGAADPERQYQRKRADNTNRWMGQSRATLQEHDKRDGLRDVLKGLKETIKKVTDKVDQTFRPNTYHYDGKTWVINEKGPDWDSESGKVAKTEIAKINTSVKKIEEKIESSKKKQDKISASRPNKALGLVGMAGASMAALKAGAASMFPPEDPDIFNGRIDSQRAWEKLKPHEKAAVQKYLEYKAESDTVSPSTKPPRGKGGYTDEPIELTSYDKLLRGQ